MNNTYKFFKYTLPVFFLFSFTSCIQDDIVDYFAKDTETIESYLAKYDVQYRKTSTLPSSGSVYITPPNEGSREIPTANDLRIFEVKLDLRRFAQERIGDPVFDVEYGDLVGTSLLKDSTYTYAMRRGAICLGATDATLNTIMPNEVLERVFIPSYLAFGGTASSGIGLEFNDIVTLENFQITAQRSALSQASHEAELVLQYAKDSLENFTEIENDTLYNGTSKTVVDEDYYGESQPLELGDYIVKHTITEGKGDVVAIGDTVQVRYEGKFTDQDGEVFDSNTGSDAAKFQVVVFENAKAAQESSVSSTVINGWYKALRTMKIGEKAVFVMPSHTAYWETGDNPNTSDLFKTIRPFKPLVFTIELKEDDQ
ncbi:FKBP-type peptidyl-prolyl cis-trans isomerase [Flammeovirga aprica]|uniref:peptidylprolyl isomerase n=1 Tax=Flammeovirga aprica JL-4 TaxID=694437 RepID=A0A7X9XCC9_9BACT|nr:FKBP-type peptidyl-prolyl cis-trans isomerase [Flammeovirga aprica]NME71504.1 FKBP-type peptidyl-prolyl cis-trans isomerase [Flammeovirga aprica JL-4]